MMKKISISTIILFMCLYSHCQISIGGRPYSFEHNILAEALIQNEIPQVELPMLDFNKLSIEDSINNLLGKPFRYGIPIEVNYDIDNSGKWIELENGDRIWTLDIKCPLAKSINLIYDKFWLPNGGLLYLYDKDKKTIIGGLNSRNNKGTKDNPKKYATGIILSDKISLEYYEPKEVRCEASISISNVVYGYIDLNILALDLCTVDINCSPEGDNWQDEKSSVALVITPGAVCTGSLMNNTRGNGIPYFLTANHCLELTNNDAILNPDASDWIFWWKYENNECGVLSYSYTQTIGATIIANDSPSDFALLKLLESPYDLSPQIQAYFNGWERQAQYGSTVCIHHPMFQPKKIAVDDLLPSSLGTRWKVTWDITSNGYSITYHGSSGAPLYNNSFGRVIGQQWSVENESCEAQVSNFGKLSVSWNNGSEPRRRLRDWLDPENSGIYYLNGDYCPGNVNVTNTNLDTDIDIYGCASIYVQNVTVLNGANVTFDAVDDVIINGSFEVALGSMIETK